MNPKRRGDGGSTPAGVSTRADRAYAVEGLGNPGHFSKRGGVGDDRVGSGVVDRSVSLVVESTPTTTSSDVTHLVAETRSEFSAGGGLSVLVRGNRITPRCNSDVDWSNRFWSVQTDRHVFNRREGCQ